MELTPGYKRTDVGVIPEEWEVRSLGEVLIRCSNGINYVASEDSGVSISRIETISNGVIDLSRVGYTSYSMSIEKYRVVEGDILYSHINSLDHIGKVAIFQGRESLFHGINLLLLRAGNCADKHYLYYWLASTRGRQQARILAKQAINQASINTSELRSVLIPLPPLPEQRAIAVALGDVDALLAAQERLIAKQRALKQAAMQQLLTGRTRLPGFEGEWQSVHFGDVLQYERPDRYIVRSTEYFANASFPVLTANKGFILGYTNEDFGVCRDLPAIVFDDFTTDCKYVDFPFKVKSSAIKLLRVKHGLADLRFIFGCMQQVQFPLGDHKRYYLSEYQHLEIMVPSLPEQRAIAAVLSDMDAAIAALEAQRAKTRLLKQGMMQELLTGRIRLV